MPASVRVETGEGKRRPRLRTRSATDLGFLQTFLLVFGFIAVFVGSFLIFNTFSITVAQRVSEFGMLRTLGASRRQILTTVLVEALAIGLLGALIGIGGGFVDRRRPERAASRRSASTCRPPTWCWSRARSSSRCWSASSSPSSPRWSRPCARPGCRRSPPCTPSRRSRPAAAGVALRRALDPARPGGPGDAARRPASAAPTAARPAGLMGGGAVVDRARRLALQPAPGAAAGGDRRAGRWSGCGACSAASRARTRSATPAAPRSPRRR